MSLAPFRFILYAFSVSFFLPLALAAAPARNQDPVLLTTNYYTVTGYTISEILASQVQARPWKTNSVFDARTDWNIEWTFEYPPARGQFRLAALEIKTRIVVTLPRWTPSPAVSPEVTAWWQRRYAALASHEHGHVKLARAAAVEMRRRLGALKHFDTVTELSEVINRTGKAVLEEYRRQEREYDWKTRHGATPGAPY